MDPRSTVMVVCTPLRWVADDLRAGVTGPDVVIVHDHGFGLPRFEVPAGSRSAWWTPAGHAARMLRAGVELNLAAPGPTWLSSVPPELLGRNLVSCQLSDVSEVGSGWAKPAEAKVPSLAAGWWDDLSEFATAAVAAGMPATSWVQVSNRRLDFAEEHRCYVLDGVVVASSPYLRDGTIGFEPGWGADPRFEHVAARSFATAAVTAFGAAQPHAYVLDVGRLRDGSWVIVEANPAWCSGTYDCVPAAVLATVIASSSSDAEHGEFSWVPDPYLVAEADRMVVLR